MSFRPVKQLAGVLQKTLGAAYPADPLCVFQVGVSDVFFFVLRTCGVAKMLFGKCRGLGDLYSLQPRQGFPRQKSGLTKAPATFRVLDRPKIAEFVAACACSCANRGKNKARPWIYLSDGFDVPGSISLMDI